MKHETNMRMGVYGFFFFFFLGRFAYLDWIDLECPLDTALFLDDRTTVDARSAGYNELSWSQSIVALVEA